MKDEQESNLTQDEEKLLWQRMANSDDLARNKLIDHYYPLARRISAQLFASRPDNDVEFDDYLQYAVSGLIEAIDRYEPNREASFATFASYRIRGSILNGVGKITEKREQSAFWQRQRKERLESLLSEDGGEIDSEHLFEEMVETTIGVALSYLLEDAGVVESQENVMTDLVYKSEAVSQLQDRMVAYVNVLPERERIIILYHYYHHMNFEELSHMLEITKGRVSQLHKQALLRLRSSFEGEDGLDLYY